MSYTGLQTDTITYWAPGTKDEYGGTFTAAPVEIKGRWEDKQERSVDADGVEFISRSVLYLSQALDKNGWVYLGTIATVDPHDVDTAYKVRVTHKDANPSSTIIVYKAVC